MTLILQRKKESRSLKSWPRVLQLVGETAGICQAVSLWSSYLSLLYHSDVALGRGVMVKGSWLVAGF